jgi:hypothetical protein
MGDAKRLDRKMLQTFLSFTRACGLAMAWARCWNSDARWYDTPEALYAPCDHPEWLLWLVVRIDQTRPRDARLILQPEAMLEALGPFLSESYLKRWKTIAFALEAVDYKLGLDKVKACDAIRTLYPYEVLAACIVDWYDACGHD